MVFCGHCASFFCVVSLDFPLLALSLWVVLSHHDSVMTQYTFSHAFLSLTAALSVDSSVGTFSEYITRKSARL